MFKSVSGLNVQQVSDATDKVKVTLNFPDNLEKVKDGYIRKYYMIRVHDNKTDILDVVVGDNNTFSFETDKFSTYALAYKDVVKTVSSPNTFDGGIVYIITLLFGFGLLLFSNKYLKRFN